MADRTGLARKRELADDEDDQILDDQAVQDILEPNHKFDLAATFVPPGGLANRVMLREALRRLERDTEGATLQHRNQPKAARTNWWQRVRSLFR